MLCEKLHLEYDVSMGIALFVGLLVVLFLLSRQVTRGVSSSIYHVFRHEGVVVWIFALVFLPGTILHELAHYVTALFLGVRVGKLELVPEVRGGGIKLGSVEVAKSDPVRGLLVSTAPIFAGVGVIIVMLFFAANYDLTWWMYGIVFYGLFVFGNTMFSSKKDMEGLWFFVILLLLGVGLVGVLGYYGAAWYYLENWGVIAVFDGAWRYMAVPVGVDLLILVGLWMLKK